MLDSRTYNNTSFYLKGAESVYVRNGDLTGATGDANNIELEVDPRDKIFTRLFVDGVEKTKSD